jgi:chorismate lyase
LRYRHGDGVMFRPSARWWPHLNGINASANMRAWLSDRTSLTKKLMMRSQRFRVQRLRQANGPCLSDECAAIGLPRRLTVREREVLLRCDEQAVVFAHTVMPLSANAADWPFFGTLGERSLGTTLFGDPKVKRGELEYAKLHSGHPLARRAMRAAGQNNGQFPLFARRCLFKRNKGVLLVTEVFLPSIYTLHALQADDKPSSAAETINHRIAVNQ